MVKLQNTEFKIIDFSKTTIVTKPTHIKIVKNSDKDQSLFIPYRLLKSSIALSNCSSSKSGHKQSVK